jgi:5-methylcytosine-specific restriction endonuclease McrA
MFKRKPNHKCPVCQLAIYKRPAEIERGRVFCSLKCFALTQRQEKDCPVCGKRMRASLKTCSRSCSNKNREGMTYSKEKDSQFPNKSRRLRTLLFEQRGSLCEICGYDGMVALQVHHIIPQCKGGGDELENLQLLCANCHLETHYSKS